MDILFLLIPLSVVLAFAIGVAFWRAIDTGQFDDLDSPGLRVVADDDRPPQSVVDGAPARLHGNPTFATAQTASDHGGNLCATRADSASARPPID